MSWELRGHTWRYTRTFRRNGRVIRQYCGTGAAAQAAARADQDRRALRAAEAEALRSLKEGCREADAALALFALKVDCLFRATLYSAGFHQHARGQWRRRKNAMPPKSRPTQPAVSPEDGLPPEEQLRLLLSRAQAGDTEVLPQLRALLDDNPHAWRQVGDVGLKAEKAWADLAAGQDLVSAESYRRFLELLKEELSTPGASRLEKLLVERVALTWFQAAHADASAAQNEQLNLTFAARELLARRQSQAQRRLLQAVQALATLRKLLPPESTPKERKGRKQESLVPLGLLERLSLPTRG